jgi:hypothetical protein
MVSSLFWDGTQRISVVTDVSGQHICPIFKGQAAQVFFDCSTLEDGTEQQRSHLHLEEV